MGFLWRLIYAVVIAGVLWLLHRKIGNYPAPLPRSVEPKREIREVVLLWGVAAVMPVLRMFAVSPWLDQTVADGWLRHLVQVPLLSVPYVALPLVILLWRNGQRGKDLGLSWKSRSRDVAIFAVMFGILSGSSMRF